MKQVSSGAAMALVLALVCGTAPAGTTTAPLTDAQAVQVFDRFLSTDWHGVYLLGTKVGWMKTIFSKSRDGARYELVSTFHARFRMLGVEQTMEVEERRSYAGPGWRLTDIAMTQTTGDRVSRMSGKATEKGFEFTHVLAGQRTTRMLPVVEESLTDALRAQVMALDPKTPIGTSAAFHQFDPTTVQEYHCTATLRRRDRLTLEGVQTDVVTLDTHIKEMNLTSTMKLTADGRLLETTVGAMFTVRLESEAVAKRLDVAVDPMAMGAIRLDRELPDVATLSELVLLVSGVEGDHFLLRSERQTFDETDSPGVYRLTLRRGRWSADEIAPGPYDRETFKRALAATPFVQSDHPEIVTLARQIVGEETDPVRRVSRLVAWVYNNLKKQYTAAMSSALDVLQTRAGDCTEHTILFVALCRAAGIPAEQVTGVVYGSGLGGFVYHAWARVYVGKWIEVDPTFNETAVHAAHIAFAVGPLEKQVALVHVVGKVKLRYVSHKKNQRGSP